MTTTGESPQSPVGSVPRRDCPVGEAYYRDAVAQERAWTEVALEQFLPAWFDEKHMDASRRAELVAQSGGVFAAELDETRWFRNMLRRDDVRMLRALVSGRSPLPWVVVQRFGPPGYVTRWCIRLGAVRCLQWWADWRGWFFRSGARWTRSHMRIYPRGHDIIDSDSDAASADEVFYATKRVLPVTPPTSDEERVGDDDSEEDGYRSQSSSAEEDDERSLANSQLSHGSRARGGYYRATSACDLAAAHNQLAMLKLLREHGRHWGFSTAEAAATHGATDVLQYLASPESGYGHFWRWRNGKLLGCAAQAPTAEAMSFIDRSLRQPAGDRAKNDAIGWHAGVTRCAAAHGRLDCLRYAHERGCPWDESCCNSAARNGHADCLRYAHERGCPWDADCVEAAIKNGHADCLRYAHEHGCPLRVRGLFRLAAHHHAWACVRYILDHLTESSVDHEAVASMVRAFRNDPDALRRSARALLPH